MPFAYYTDATVVDARGAAALGVAVERLVHNRRGKRLFLSLFSCSSSYLVTGAGRSGMFLFYFIFSLLRPVRWRLPKRRTAQNKNLSVSPHARVCWAS
jgi:hypothetical protein